MHSFLNEVKFIYLLRVPLTILKWRLSFHLKPRIPESELIKLKLSSNLSLNQTFDLSDDQVMTMNSTHIFIKIGIHSHHYSSPKNICLRKRSEKSFYAFHSMESRPSVKTLPNKLEGSRKFPSVKILLKVLSLANILLKGTMNSTHTF